MTNPARPTPRLTFGPDGPEPGERVLAAEVAVALTFNGTTQAVMMATPADLTDFAYGFALTEGIATPGEVLSVEIVEAGDGLDIQCWLQPQAEARLADRRRTMAGPVGCGLCGIDSIGKALAEPHAVTPGCLRLAPSDVKRAVAAMTAGQTLHDATRAVHGAAFWSGGRMIATREDVGRHNALDKLAGHLAQTRHDEGAVVLTSRVSIDLVQKVARMGVSVMIAVSAPTAAAVDLANRLGITLIANARADRFDLYTHSDRIESEASHVG